MALVDRINSRLAELRHRDAALSINDWAEYFTFGGNTYPVVQTTMGTVNEESVGATSIGGFKGNGPIFSLVLARLQVFSQVRFQWTRFSGSQPTDLFGSPELGVLERPWLGGTTSDLLARMEVHASVAGCAYVTRPKRDRLSLLRPDRVTIIMGSETDAKDPSEAPDVEIVGYVHETSRGKMTIYTDPRQVAYYAPIPDPDYRFLGMSWITPVIRELQADGLATEHKARFFINSATPNLAIKFDASIGLEKVQQFKALLESEHRGAFNAWRTLYLGGGADPVTVGNSFKDMDYAVIQGRAESRLAAAAGVPPSWVGFAEGLQGSSLNAGNFNSARRRFSDGTMIHLWTNAATSLEVLLDRPPGATLWYDPRVPFMREDAQDLAGIQQKQAQTIVSLVKDGFTPESAVAAVTKNDWGLLVHTGLLSVQLQEPGANVEHVVGHSGVPVDAPPPTNGRRHQPGRHPQKNHASGQSWAKGLLDLAGGTVEVAKTGDRLSLQVGDGDVSLPEDTLRDLSARLRNLNRLRVGRSHSVADYAGDGGESTYARALMSVTRTGDDEFELESAAGDGAEPPQTTGTLTVTAAEAARIAWEIDRVAAAQQVKTKAGEFTSVVQRDGRFTLGFPATAGKPVTLTMSRDQADDIELAVFDLSAELGENVVFDEDDNPVPVVPAGQVVASRRREAGSTTLTIDAYGTDLAGEYTFQSDAHDWVLRLPADHAERIATAIERSVAGTDVDIPD